MSKINIFVSHKHEDKLIAQRLKKKLCDWSNQEIVCFISEEIEYGAEWFNRIKENLIKSNILIWTFTSPDKSWNWSLLEVGYATDLQNSKFCRVIALHPPGTKPPDPLSHLQTLEASEENIEHFLYELLFSDKYSETKLSIEQTPILSKQVTKFAVELSNYFRSINVWEHCFTNSFWVVSPINMINENGMPKDAHIEIEKGSTFLSFLNLMDTPPNCDNWKWKDILVHLDKQSSSKDWLDELNERFYYASQGEILRETKSVFKSNQTGDFYRPLLHRVEVKPNGNAYFEVVFVKHYELDES